MYCPQCGKQNPEDARFCGSCGAPLDEIRNNGDYLQMEEPSVWNDSNEGQGKEKDRNHKKCGCWLSLWWLFWRQRCRWR